MRERPCLTCSWDNNILSIHGGHLPGKRIDLWYFEAYCRPGSTSRPWHETVIPHRTELVSGDLEQTALTLRCILYDGVIVEHRIECRSDTVEFHLAAHNPTDRPSLAHWAQPCVHVGAFTGFPDAEDGEAYIQRCFVFLDGKLSRMPTRDWAVQALYTPGQVWFPAHVPRTDANPRPLNPNTPDNGLIGCFSSDDSMILATAWEPWQELFQGVSRCLHSDFRIGGLEPGETKRIRGTLYLVENNVESLLSRYRRDFPEHLDAAD